MRDIKFRGISRKTGEWVYGLPKYGSGGSIDFIAGWMGEEGFEQYQEVDIVTESLGEYMGSKDKNSLEIYEHDILRDVDGCIYQIWYDEVCGAYLIGRKGQWDDWAFNFLTDILEIIGNIHQQSYLLNPTTNA